MSNQRSTGDWSVLARQQAAVARVGQLGLEGVGLDDLLAEALVAVTDVFDAHYVTLLELDDEWRSFGVRAAAAQGRMVDQSVFRDVRVPAGRDSLPGYTVMQGSVVSTEDLHHDQRFRSQTDQYGMAAQAAIAAPVGWGERPWGVLGAWVSTVPDWSDDDLHFIQSMANTVGLAVYRKRAEDALRESRARLELSLQASGHGVWAWEFDSAYIELTPDACPIYGLAPGTTRLTDDDYLDRVHPDDRTNLRGDAYEAIQTDGQYHVQFRFFHEIRNEFRWLECWGRVVEDVHGRPLRLIGVTVDITERRLEAARMEALYVAEQQAREFGEEARDRMAFLVEVSARFVEALDPESIIAALTELTVPRIADVCFVDLLDESQKLVEVGRAGATPEVLEAFVELRRRREALGGSGGVYDAVSIANSAQGVLLTDFGDDALRSVSVDDEHLAVFQRAASLTGIVVPLIARGRIVGVLSLATTAVSGRHYGPDDLAMAQELADRAAMAYDNGRLFESRNRVSRSLQSSLLPPALPPIAGLDLAARYEVGEADFEIGGDFYDVIEMGGNTWGLVVGDVCGRGPEAAVLTGLMRHSVRTAVVREQLPSRVLTQTNDAVIGQIDENRFCTAAYLRVEILDGGGVRVVASSAGHPRPIVLRSDGRAEFVNCRGLLLGVVQAPELIDVEIDLAPGDAVILYTDGVTEARSGDEFFGENRLIAVVERYGGSAAERIASGIIDAVNAFDDHAADDRAILVVRRPD